MRAAALKFPELVAKTPMRTHAILTRYTALKSFQALGAQFSPVSYEHAQNYAAALQESYLDYKNIAKDIQVLAFDVANGTFTLVKRENVNVKDVGENAVKASQPTLLASMVATPPEGTSAESVQSDDSLVAVKAPEASEDTNTVAIPAGAPKAVQPLVISKAYEPSIFGLEAARVHCRFMMNRIVAEVFPLSFTRSFP